MQNSILQMIHQRGTRRRSAIKAKKALKQLLDSTHWIKDIKEQNKKNLERSIKMKRRVFFLGMDGTKKDQKVGWGKKVNVVKKFFWSIIGRYSAHFFPILVRSDHTQHTHHQGS